MWAGVLDARAALPDTAVVVLCPQEDAFTPPGAGMRGVAVATPDTLAQVVQAQLTVQEERTAQFRREAEKSAVHQRKQRGKRNTREKAGVLVPPGAVRRVLAQGPEDVYKRQGLQQRHMLSVNADHPVLGADDTVRYRAAQTAQRVTDGNRCV